MAIDVSVQYNGGLLPAITLYCMVLYCTVDPIMLPLGGFVLLYCMVLYYTVDPIMLKGFVFAAYDPT